MVSTRFLSRLAWLALLSVLNAQPAWGAVTARVDVNPVMQGEAVQLTVEADSAHAGEPDFTPLEQDFTILRQSSGTQITTIGATTTRLRTWSLLLAPKRTGNLLIPPIRVGQAASDPIAVEVRVPDPQAGQTAPAFIEFSADTTQPYVRQQVQLSVKLFVSGQLASGGLSDPAADGAVIEQIGEQRESQATRGQTRYRVFERDYVLFAEAAGELTVLPPSFNGELRSGRSPRALFNFGGMGDTRTVVANGDAITLQVQAPPANAPADRWLPATQVTLSQKLLPPNVEPRVGEPLTREIVVTVDGQLHTQLAPLELPGVSGAQTYAEPQDGSTRAAPGGGVRGVQTRRWAVIPQSAGALVLPPVSVRWWDVNSDQLQTATLPELRLNVRASPASAAATQPAAQQPAAQQSPKPSQASAEPAREQTTWWRIAALVAMVGWLLTALAWATSRWLANRTWRAMRKDQRRQQRAEKSAVLAACKAGHARAARGALLGWSRSRFDAPDLARLDALPALLRQAGAPAALIRDTEVALQSLDQAAFGGSGTNTWQTLAELIPRLDALKARKTRRRTQELPPLYPA